MHPLHGPSFSNFVADSCLTSWKESCDRRTRYRSLFCRLMTSTCRHTTHEQMFRCIAIANLLCDGSFSRERERERRMLTYTEVLCCASFSWHGKTKIGKKIRSMGVWGLVRPAVLAGRGCRTPNLRPAVCRCQPSAVYAVENLGVPAYHSDMRVQQLHQGCSRIYILYVEQIFVCIINTDGWWLVDEQHEEGGCTDIYSGLGVKCDMPQQNTNQANTRTVLRGVDVTRVTAESVSSDCKSLTILSKRSEH